MKNDFFKHILLSSCSKQNRTELETETLPYTFTSDAYKLRNYRIYGNTVGGESVGDLVTDGEHSGEYCVPVTVESKNILPMSTTPISRDIDDFHCEYDGAGTITLTTDKDYAQLSKFYIPLSQDFVIPISVGQGGDGCLQINNSVTSAPNTYMVVIFLNNNDVVDTWGMSTINRINSNYTSMGGQTMNGIAIQIVGKAFGTNRKLVIKPAFFRNITEQVPFEPYHEPITTNIYLTAQLKVIENETEYVDFKTQQQYFAGGTSENVGLPAIMTLSGTNIISVGTTVQPSKIWIQGNISEIETVSAETQALQTNIQSLQPLLLDENAELDVMPSDNLETTGDEENAE